MQNPEVDSAHGNYKLEPTGPDLHRFEAGAPSAKDLDVLPLALLILQIWPEPLQERDSRADFAMLDKLVPFELDGTSGSTKDTGIGSGKGARQIRTVASLPIQKPGAMMLGVTLSTPCQQHSSAYLKALSGGYSDPKVDAS